MRIAVIGAGNGGAAATVELTLAGHEVALHGRSAATLAPLEQHGVGYRGVLGEGELRPALITTHLDQAIAGADAAVVALPTFALGSVARALAAAGWDADKPVILNPGHTGGALEFRAACRRAGAAPPPIAEFATLSYVARKPSPGIINVTGRAKALRAAALPGGQAALDAAMLLFPGSYDCGSTIATALCNVNMVVHPPGAMLGASWVEATGGDFTFYVEGLTDGVTRVMAALDKERMAVAQALGHELPTIIDEMKAIGTVPSHCDSKDYRAIAAGEANQRIKAPDSLSHRYFTEDFSHGLTPFLVFADVAGIAAPITRSLVNLHAALVGDLARPAPRDAVSMGLETLSLAGLLDVT